MKKRSNKKDLNFPLLPVIVMKEVSAKKPERWICHKRIILGIVTGLVRGIERNSYKCIFSPGSGKDSGQNDDANYNYNH